MVKFGNTELGYQFTGNTDWISYCTIFECENFVFNNLSQNEYQNAVKIKGIKHLSIYKERHVDQEFSLQSDWER